MAIAIQTGTFTSLAMTTVICLILSQKTLADNHGCHLNISSWHKGKPFLYQKDEIKRGIYPELFREIFGAISCTVDVTHYPAARIKARASLRKSDGTFVGRPHGSNFFTADIKYLSSQSSENQQHQMENLPTVITTPILFPHLGIVGSSTRKTKPVSSNISEFTIGSFSIPQRNPLYWKDFFGLPTPPTAFNSNLQGLKAVAAGRIDGYATFYATIDDFPNPDHLQIIKPIHPMELRILLHQRGIDKLPTDGLIKLNTRIKHMHKTGRIKALVEKYGDDNDFYWPEELYLR